MHEAAARIVGGSVAVGRAVRLSIVTVAIINFFIGFAIWGISVTVRIAG